jgi:hypothetical protein
MSEADDRKAKGIRLGALIRGVPLVSVCWSPSPNSAHPWCGGTLVWSKDSGEWRSSCPRCGASGLAAVGEGNDLDAAAVGPT